MPNWRSGRRGSPACNRTKREAQQIEQAVADRVQEGVDSTIDLNKAKLAAARVRLHRAEASGSADVLRRHLADLTGLPVSAIELVPESIPALPPVAADEDSSGKAVASSPTIKFADQHALAEAMRAIAEHRAIYPSLDFSAQYARLSTFNNYAEFYRTFRPDNATIGVAIRFPIFNASQRGTRADADFDALKAKKQAEAARDQVSEETLKLQSAAEQLEAARDVAELEYELAESARKRLQTRIEAKTGTLSRIGRRRGAVQRTLSAFSGRRFRISARPHEPAAGYRGSGELGAADEFHAMNLGCPGDHNG